MIRIYHPLDESKFIATLEYTGTPGRIVFREVDPDTTLEVSRFETNVIPKKPRELAICINVDINGLATPGQINIYGDLQLIHNRALPTDWLLKYNFVGKACYSISSKV